MSLFRKQYGGIIKKKYRQCSKTKNAVCKETKLMDLWGKWGVAYSFRIKCMHCLKTKWPHCNKNSWHFLENKTVAVIKIKIKN